MIEEKQGKEKEEKITEGKKEMLMDKSGGGERGQVRKKEATVKEDN